ncbi:MAG: class II 3-deoxy-7-phosphoheptulonate synthase [Ferrimicrobium sp.]
MGEWTPWDWQECRLDQQPEWPDQEALASVERDLAMRPPLVYPGEVDALTSALARVAGGRAFLLQAGDCAESFIDHSAGSIRAKLRVILQMAVVLTYSSGVSVVKVGRMAGQYAKPRSQMTEIINEVSLPVFRGHIVHSDEPTLSARHPDPLRMLQAYDQSRATLEIVKALAGGGFADLSQAHSWNQDFVAASSEGRRYESIAAEISRALRFMAACGIDLQREEALHLVSLWSSHEALLLGYEAALTRRDPHSGRFYDLSGHMVWVGERTRSLDGGHLRFVSGIANPVGVKVGPTVTPEELLEICERLDPTRRPGRLTLVSRMGAGIVRERLGPLVRAVKEAGFPVIWLCDPMHGNTFLSDSGFKTRRFEDIIAEIAEFFAVHREVGTWAGGIHIELTGSDVTECLGGSLEVKESELCRAYDTICDPRLNARQSLDLAYRVAELLIG